MLSSIKDTEFVVGVKQSKKVITTGMAKRVFIAKDAEMRVIKPIIELCEAVGTEIAYAVTMQELGKAAGIDVGAAVIVQLK